jgi:hypothetical protein
MVPRIAPGGRQESAAAVHRRGVPSVTMEEAVEQQAVWTEAPLTGATPTAVVEATERARAEAQKAKENRRSHKRVPGKALDWVEVARVKYGPEVAIVDLSKGGVLVESDRPLKPGSKQALEIAAGGKTIVVPFGVLRSKISALGPKGAVYRAACAFNRILDLPQLVDEEADREADAIDAGAVVDRPFTPEPLMDTVLRESGSVTAWASEPAVSTGWQKTVARFADGTVVKGYNIDFDVNRPVFSLSPTPDADSDRVTIPVAALKGVFFVRDFDGDAKYQERKTFFGQTSGRRVHVKFNDGEMVVGTTQAYRADGAGFYLTPADPRANNTRIFVVSSAVRQVRFP